MMPSITLHFLLMCGRGGKAELESGGSVRTSKAAMALVRNVRRGLFEEYFPMNTLFSKRGENLLVLAQYDCKASWDDDPSRLD